MLSATLKCQACGTKFQADLDRGDASCPQCGSSNTVTVAFTDNVKKIIT
jgi:DNA-directed RNA polymerase subunit RPC12/RpoP